MPVQWSETEHVVWKTPIPDKGWSSPVVWGTQVWVTTATADGTELKVLCLDRETGKILHEIGLFHVNDPQFAHQFNSYASPTPVIEEGRIYVTFGSPGTACLDTATGRVLWQRRDFVCNHFRGAGSSPILDGDRLIMDFDGSDFQYVVALDKRTGKTVWRTERSVDFQDLTPEGKPQGDGDFRKAFSTPLVAELDSRPVLLSLGSKAFYAYEPATGQELWRVENRRCHSGTARPVLGKGLIFVEWGFSRGELWAVRPGGSGVLGEENVAWMTRRSVGSKPSPVLVGDWLFIIDDGGIASCLDAKTGKEQWRERVSGNYSASPIATSDRIYVFSEEGKATVLAAGPEFKVLNENHLDDGFMASPAAAGDALFLRTKSALYRIE